ncbi:MAG: stimulus-sensing domain-containing protein [Parvibaculales bacterium]
MLPSLNSPFPNPSPGRRSLLTRLIAINALGLLAFLGGLLLLGQTRESLTEAYRQSLLVQGRIMAEAVGGLGGDTVEFAVMPDVTEGAQGNVLLPAIDAREATLLLQRLVAQTSIRVRYYDHKGELVVDTARMPGTVRIAELDGAEPKPAPKGRGLLPELGRGELQLLTDDIAADASKLAEVQGALNGKIVSLTRVSSDDRDILTLAVPVQHYRAINGVLMLTSPPGTIDEIVFNSRNATLRLFLVIFTITLVLTVLVARTITMPVQKLAGALRQYQQTEIFPELDKIPDYSGRGDEVADLSNALRGLLDQLRQRLDSIERFAADVAHELKNPLASMQSALETLETTQAEADKQALMAILLTDIHRLNRLISDISAASRLDAEMGREEFERLDFSDMVKRLVPVLIEASQKNLSLKLAVVENVMVLGQENRLAQILQNLLDNAISFAPQRSEVQVSLTAGAGRMSLTVRDEGPGVPADVSERVFERFYTDRAHSPEPPETVSEHSGLGLSIARDIACQHGGNIMAHASSGGVFELDLPIADPEVST